MSRQTANDNLSLNDTTPPLSSIDKNSDGTPRAPQKKKNKPRIILMGLRRSGKSSIQQVVFHKLVANETLFLESTNQVQTDEIVSFIEFQVWDFPGQIDFSDSSFDSELLTSEGGSVVFVIDAQDDYVDALHKLHSTVAHAYRLNPNLSFEVFIHKVDGLSDDYKIETQREIQMRTMDELADSGLEDIHLSFHLTSIYDHSIFEALSKVIQKLIPQLPTLENLLNILCSNSGIEKAFLFDVSSKIYVATDSSPVDMQSYEICSDMIDVIFDISTIYGPPRTIPESTSQTMIEPSHSSTTTPVSLHQSAPNDDKNGTGAAIEACSVDVKTNSVVTANRGATGKKQNQSYSIIKLNNGMALYLREMNKTLALVCLLRVENFEKHGLIDYNFHCFEEALNKIFQLRRQHEQ